MNVPEPRPPAGPFSAVWRTLDVVIALAVVLTVAGGQITHLHLFEDSFAVAAAARAKPCVAPNR